MIIAYVCVGFADSGINRYARMIAAQVQSTPDMNVQVVPFTLPESAQSGAAAFAPLIAQLQGADILHLQYNRHLWGPPKHHRAMLESIISRVDAAVVATLHDVYVTRRRSYSPGAPKPPIWRRIPGRIHAALHDLTDHVPRVIRWLASRARVVVHSHEEARRLRTIGIDHNVSVIPHFIEPAPDLPDPIAARRELDLEGRRVITLLGFLFSRKGHRLLLRAVPLLPKDVTVILAGGSPPGAESFRHEIEAAIDAASLRDRVRITGFLSDADLHRCIAATNLAVCPFVNASASGSLSTWFAAGKPVLASDLPLMHEYNALAPGAINVFAPYTPPALARAITELLPQCDDRIAPPIARLQEKLSIENTVSAYFDVYRNAVQSRIT
jgi:glycosyltransferase involved in cell wall biosynthesis